MSTRALWTQCKDCALCQSSRYQSPPLLGIFGDNPILVVAQNPGEAKQHRPEHVQAAAEMTAAGTLREPDALAYLYKNDFIHSYAYKVGLHQFFGADWLDRFDYTNAVRCRTPINEYPSAEMMFNCGREYTSKLIRRYDAIIFIGAAARMQFNLMMSPVSSLSPMVIRKGKTGRLYLAVPHYAARDIDFQLVKRRVEELVSRVRSLHEQSSEDVEV